MKRFIVLLTLGMLAAGVILTPLVLAATAPAPLKQGQNGYTRTGTDFRSPSARNQESFRAIWVNIGKSFLAFKWPWITITVINITIPEDGDTDKLDPPMANPGDPPVGDDNGWEEGLL